MNKERVDRQIRVIGKEAQKKLSSSSVLIVGLGGLGVEIAKDLILAGFSKIGIHDTKKTEFWDLSSQFYCSEDDVGKRTRCQASLKNLKALNEYCKVVDESSFTLGEDLVKRYDCVVFTENHISSLKEIDDFCSKNGIYFIAGECRGVFGSIFCDFGPKFICKDVDGEKEATGIVTDIKIDENGNAIVSTYDENNPVVQNLSNGDVIKFSNIKGLEELNTEKVIIQRKDGFTFNVGKISNTENKYLGGGRYVQVKQPKIIKFKPLKESIKTENNFVIYNFGKFGYPQQLHTAFQALGIYFEKNNRLPRPYNVEDSNELISFGKSIDSSCDATILKKLSFTARGVINPMTTFIGGLMAQEIQKAVTGKFHPFHQWFHFENMECLPDNMNLDPKEYEPQNCRYDSQIAVFGKQFQEKLGNLNYFLVGAGALGCEFAKNFAMGGVCCGKGKLTITDMDDIEISNLSRQFLFHECHVGKMKSQVAGEVVKQMNNGMNVEAMNDRVGEETEEVFNSKFFNSLDGIMNALDNIQARRYMDSRAVFYRKPLFDSGTLGAKAHTQIIIPHQTINYAGQRDVETKEFPECTIHAYPNSIEHCVAWSKRLFNSFFFGSGSEVNLFLNDRKSYLLKNEFNFFNIQTVYNSLIHDKPGNFKDCVAWAYKKFHELYNYGIRNILFNHPPEKKTKSGSNFWSGNKRCPKPLNQFDWNDKEHQNFIICTSKLFASFYGIQFDGSVDFENICKNTDRGKFIPMQTEDEDEDEKMLSDEEIMRLQEEEKKKIEKDRITLEKFKNELEKKDFGNLQLNLMKFEKNDEDHIKFVTACSNLRGRCYQIPEIDVMETKGIAGNIIPAMITTTAIATGLVMFELYKYHQGFDLDKFYNTFLNIGIPNIIMVKPKDPPKKILNEYTVWDRALIKKPKDISLSSLISILENNYDVKIKIVAYKGVPLIMPNQTEGERQKRLKAPVWKLTEYTIGEKIKSDTLSFVVAAEKNGRVLEEFLPVIYQIDKAMMKRLKMLKKRKKKKAKKKA